MEIRGCLFLPERRLDESNFNFVLICGEARCAAVELFACGVLVVFLEVDTPSFTSVILFLKLDSVSDIRVSALFVWFVVLAALRVTAGELSSSLDTARSLFSLGLNS